MTNEDRIQEVWDEVWAFLERGETEPACARALRALNEEGDEPEYRYLLGISLLDLGEAAAAVTELERAVELSDEWADAHAGLAWALFRTWRFDDASREIEAAIRLDEEMADAHQLRGLIAEQAGEDSLALLSFAEARRLDPEAYPEPIEMDEEEFLQIARAAVDELDERSKALLDATALFVRPFPTRDLVGDDEDIDPQILGLFLGRSLLEQSVDDSGALPNTMYLFQRNLERMAESREDLAGEIRITVLHEIAHHFGWSDEELEEKGFG